MLFEIDLINFFYLLWAGGILGIPAIWLAAGTGGFSQYPIILYEFCVVFKWEKWKLAQNVIKLN